MASQSDSLARQILIGIRLSLWGPPVNLSIVAAMDQATAGNVGKLWIIVLAAGASRRLGTAKQLLRAGRRTLLAQALSRAAAVAPGRVIAVLGSDALRIRSHIRRTEPHTRIVHNRAWSCGMGTSLAAGIGALPQRADAALIMLCDQPNIDVAALRRLCAAHRANRSAIVASQYAGRLGAPAIFPRACFGELGKTATTGGNNDRGARELLNGAASGFRRIAVAMPGAAFDVDTPEQAAQL